MAKDREMLLCLVKFLQHYLLRTVQYHPICSNLFVSSGKVKKKNVDKNTLFWLRTIINKANRSTSDGDCTAEKAVVLLCSSERNLQSSKLLEMEPGHSDHTLILSQDVAHRPMDTLSISPVVAAQQVV